ncbi:hypothetical protein LSAT2_006533 [Lamellibrachia satsuma]|nr:hypothetical protein LSAT2_006533 [Lamellibrachia satsuma]
MADSRDNLPDQVTMAMVNHYLTTTGIEDVFKDLCHNLLKSPRLPYNPYPGLVRQLRAYAESFTYHSVDDEDVYQQLVYQVQNTTIPEIAQPINGDPIFGTANSVEMIKPSVLNKYRWLLTNVTPHVSRLHQESGYVQHYMALSTLTPPAVNFRVEFIIIGSDVNKAVHIFLQSVTNDIIHMESAGQHIFLGLTVPVRDRSDETKWQLLMYSVGMLQNKKSETWEAIYEAMVAHKEISAECLFRLSDGGDSYKPGQKQYHLNFVEIEEASGSEKG